jgi:glyoxylase-like metal-dependent hydrolase (beta-lactamase superfamily II)
VTVIDSGLKGSAERVLRAVEAAGRKAQDVRQIVITQVGPSTRRPPCASAASWRS